MGGNSMRTRFRLGALAAAAALTLGTTLWLATPANAVAGTYYFSFNKTSSTPTSNPSSKLVFWHSLNPDYPPTQMASWKAGSGQSTNPCQKSVGWLPNGHYTIKQAYLNHLGGTGGVNGPALELSNHACSDGTVRTELFIHSSYPWSSTHYMSEGCIKLASSGTPSTASGDVKSAYNQWVNVHPETKTSGNGVSDALTVFGP